MEDGCGGYIISVPDFILSSFTSINNRPFSRKTSSQSNPCKFHFSALDAIVKKVYYNYNFKNNLYLTISYHSVNILFTFYLLHNCFTLICVFYKCSGAGCNKAFIMITINVITYYLVNMVPTICKLLLIMFL